MTQAAWGGGGRGGCPAGSCHWEAQPGQGEVRPVRPQSAETDGVTILCVGVD